MRIPQIVALFLVLALGERAFSWFARQSIDLIDAVTILSVVGVVFIRSKVARWIYSVPPVGGLTLVAWAIFDGQIDLQRLSWMSWVTGAWLLMNLMIIWSPPMSRWIGSKSSIPT